MPSPSPPSPEPGCLICCLTCFLSSHNKSAFPPLKVWLSLSTVSYTASHARLPFLSEAFLHNPKPCLIGLRHQVTMLTEPSSIQAPVKTTTALYLKAPQEPTSVRGNSMSALKGPVRTLPTPLPKQKTPNVG
jgi:hypothetical protein